ncbi:hypothetical protein [Agromyces bauzanensis]
MSTTMPDRPMRRPRPAADDSVDPIDFVAPAAKPEAPAEAASATPSVIEQPATAVAPAEPAAAPSPRATKPAAGKKATKAAPTTEPETIRTGRVGRPRHREVALPFSTRLSEDVLELIDTAVDEHGLTQRAVVERAVRETWGRS